MRTIKIIFFGNNKQDNCDSDFNNFVEECKNSKFKNSLIGDEWKSTNNKFEYITKFHSKFRDEPKDIKIKFVEFDFNNLSDNYFNSVISHCYDEAKNFSNCEQMGPLKKEKYMI